MDYLTAEQINDIKNIQKFMADPVKYISYDWRDGTYEPRRIILNWPAKNYFGVVPGFKNALEDAESLSFWQTLESEISRMLTKKADAKKEAEKEADAKTVELRIHTGESEDCENTVHRTGFMVRMTVGEFAFSREYGLETENVSAK